MVTKADIALVRSLADRRSRVENGLFVVEGPKMVGEALRSGWRVRQVLGSGDILEQVAASASEPQVRAGHVSVGRLASASQAVTPPSRAASRMFSLRSNAGAAGGITEQPTFETVSSRDLERMSSLKTPQGVLAVVEIPIACHPERQSGDLLEHGAASAGEPQAPSVKRSAEHAATVSPTHTAGGRNAKARAVNALSPSAGGVLLALDAVQDPGNLGTIMRTADWFGIRSILCSPECADRFNPKAVQASMGALFRVEVSYGELVFPEGVPVFGAFMDGDDIYNVDFFAESDSRGDGTGSSRGAGIAGAVSPVIVLGNEGRGISPAVASRVTRRVSIPSFDAAPESLNVAAAAAIFCSELFRRQCR